MTRDRMGRRCRALYLIAVRADRAFALAIERHAGKGASRWSLTAEQRRAIPEVRRAYLRKVRVDAALHRCNVALLRRTA